MAPEQDPSTRRPIRPEQLPDDLLVTGGAYRDDRLRGNPGAHEHAPTFSKIYDVYGEPVEVVKITTTSYDANQVRVEPKVRKEIVEAMSLWAEGLPEHHLLTHALRFLQNCSITENGTEGPVRRRLPDGQKPQKYLEASGLDSKKVQGVIDSLKKMDLVIRRDMAGKKDPMWMIETSIKGIGPNGEKYKVEDLKDGWRLPDAPEKITSAPGSSAETAQDSANPFYIGNRPRLTEQSDRDQVLTKVHQALLHFARNHEQIEAEEGWITFDSRGSVYRELARLTGATETQLQSICEELIEIDFIKPTKRVGVVDGTSTASFRWTVASTEESVSWEQVEVIREFRKEQRRQRAARKAAAAGIRQTAEVVSSEASGQFTAEIVKVVPETSEPGPADLPVPPTYEEPAEQVDLGAVLGQIGQDIKTMRVELDEKTGRVETLTAEKQEIADKLDQAQQTIQEQAAEIASLQSQLAVERAKTTIDPDILKNIDKIRKLLGGEDN